MYFPLTDFKCSEEEIFELLDSAFEKTHIMN
jgi:hypothetical protein